MLNLIWLVPALPLTGFLLIFLLGRRFGEPLAGIVATVMTASSFVVVVGIFFDLLSRTSEEREHVFTVFSWLPVGKLQIDMALLADPLSITMALFITGIGTLIHLYSIGYMHGDPKFPKFFMYLNLFVFSMLMLVLGSNMLVVRPGQSTFGPGGTNESRPFEERDVAALKQMLERELPELKDGDYEPGWNEIKSLDAKVDWTRFQAPQAAQAATAAAKKK